MPRLVQVRRRRRSTLVFSAAIAVEALERRLVAHGDHVHLPDGMTVEDINNLPAEHPLQYDLHLEDEPAHRGEGDVLIPAPMTTIRNSGAPSNRVDIVLVGDGYTSAQLSTYSTHANSFLANFFNEAPFNRYSSYFNVHRVDVTSAESGVDNDPTNGIARNTALGMGFFCSGIERLLCVNTAAARDYALNAPQVDQIIAIANSTKYGGAGYPGADIGTYSGGNSSSIEVAKHEFGHAFGDLGDEYTYGGPIVHSPNESSYPNLSVQNAATMAANQTKWARWLDLPNVDAFEGGDYSEQGIYRPTVDSKMRNLGRPFEEVNIEQMILKVYAAVRPIDAATAAGAYQTQTSTFSVDPVDPASGPALSVQWFVDDIAVPGATGLNFSPAQFGIEGNHTLKVVVRDTTTAVRDEARRATLMTDTRTWTLRDTLAPTVTFEAYNVDAPRQEVRVKFNETVGASVDNNDLVLVNLTTGQTLPASAIAASYDTFAKRATFSFPGLATGLPDGNYRASLATNGVVDSAGNAASSSETAMFFIKAGDANRDRAVNFADLVILAQNYNQAGKTFTEGNFNYSTDGKVDFADLVILAQKYNTTLAVASASFSTVSVGEAVGPRKRERRLIAPDLV